MCQPPIAESKEIESTQCRCGFPVRVQCHTETAGRRTARVFALKALHRVRPNDRIYQCPCCTQDFRNLSWEEAQRRFGEGFGA
jgi:hypothetical protein